MINVETFKKEIESEIQTIANNLKKQIRFKNASEQTIIEYATKMYYNNTTKKIKNFR
jgi:hypothetical protein